MQALDLLIQRHLEQPDFDLGFSSRHAPAAPAGATA
jgi:hypothetical protein